MDHFVAIDMTEAVRTLFPDRPRSPGLLKRSAPRVPSERGLHAKKVRARDERRLLYGESTVELSSHEHIRDAAHLQSIGLAMRLLAQDFIDGRRRLATALAGLNALLNTHGVEALSPYSAAPGALIRPRTLEVGAALNRLRTLHIKERRA